MKLCLATYRPCTIPRSSSDDNKMYILRFLFKFVHYSCGTIITIIIIGNLQTVTLNARNVEPGVEIRYPFKYLPC